MLRKWIGQLLNVEFASPLDTQVWECTPLVVLNEAGDIEFSQGCTVEYTPTGKKSPFAYAKVTGGPNDDQLPVLEVRFIDRKEAVITRISWLAFPVPMGTILYGTDIGEEYRWFINGPAIQVLEGQYLGPRLRGGRMIG